MADESILERKAGFLDQLLEKDPDIRSATLKALQKLNPSEILPEVKADEKIEQVYTRAREDAVKEIESKLKEREFQNAILHDKQTARSRFNLSDDEVAKVEDLMKTKGIANYEAGAEYYRLMTKAAQPASVASSPGFDLPDRKEMAELWNQPDKYSLKVARSLMPEINERLSKQ